MLQKIFVLLSITAVVLLAILFRSTDQTAPIDLQVDTNNPQLTINIVAHKVAGEHLFVTKRDREDIMRVINAAQQIWSQANIVFEISVIETKVSEQAIKAFTNGNFNAVLEEDFYQQGVINIFFIDNLPANGLAVNPSAAFVNDSTNVNDFRATAHEIGHLLGLEHTTASRTRLLYRGVNGALLIPVEIELARTTAAVFK